MVQIHSIKQCHLSGHHLPSGIASPWISVCLSPGTHPKISENLAFLPMTGLSYYLYYIDFFCSHLLNLSFSKSTGSFSFLFHFIAPTFET